MVAAQPTALVRAPTVQQPRLRRALLIGDGLSDSLFEAESEKAPPTGTAFEPG